MYALETNRTNNQQPQAHHVSNFLGTQNLKKEREKLTNLFRTEEEANPKDSAAWLPNHIGY